MSKYREWKKPKTPTELVKVGWSWPALIFGGLWAIAKRMTMLGIALILLWLAIGYTLSIIVPAEDFEFITTGASLLYSLILGANGNSLREWHLRRLGFKPGPIKERPFFYTVRTFFSSPIVSLKALWRDRVMSAVIAGLAVAAIVGGISYIRSPSSPTGCRKFDGYEFGEHTFFVPTCKRATINGCVEPNGEPTLAWFEWGEMPEDLARSTPKQLFTQETNYYQDLTGLNESSTYFYRAVVENANGIGVGRVNSFTTARCER